MFKQLYKAIDELHKVITPQMRWRYYTELSRKELQDDCIIDLVAFIRQEINNDLYPEGCNSSNIKRGYILE